MASLREESDSEGSSYSLSDNENLTPQKKKRDDMVDVNCSNDNFARKQLIFTMATGLVVTASPSFNNFLQNKIKSLRSISWSAIFIGSYVIFVKFFR